MQLKQVLIWPVPENFCGYSWAYVFYWIRALMCQILLDSSHNVYRANVWYFISAWSGIGELASWGGLNVQ